MIKFNEDTWYSRLGAIVLFLGIVPILAFYIGMQYEKRINTDEVDMGREVSKHRKTVSVRMPDDTTRSVPAITKGEAEDLFNACDVEKAYDAFAGTFIKNKKGETFIFTDSTDFQWLSEASKKAYWCLDKPSVGIE